jgi:glycine/D-amino acid oxidase-like deaminating enzyme
METDRFDALIIGGGFFGCCIALHLRERGLARVGVAERGGRLLGRASYGNQARVHHGYHYPRDFTTAYRSRMNFRRWTERYRAAVDDTFVMLYAVARRNSLVTARQFAHMMSEIGAPCTPAPRRQAALFSPALVEAVFETEEYAFDADRLAAMLADDMERAGVEVMLDTTASVLSCGGGGVRLGLDGPAGQRSVGARMAFNTTYGMLAHVPGTPPVSTGIKYEIAEICLVEPPPELRGFGVTLMDGPFFSCMPFPARGLHSFTHVRYTPHVWWTEETAPGRDPYAFLDSYPRVTSFGDMQRDASLFLPALERAAYRDSIFEVKVVLVANEQNDGRPILVEGDPAAGGVVTVLGGKLDNIFDVLSVIDEKGPLA